MTESAAQKQNIATDAASVFIDRFRSSRISLVVAFVWGFAEAVFFFFVPDILLTMLAGRAIKPAFKASLVALAGALMGGAFMYAFAFSAADAARWALDYVPAISPKLISRVTEQIEQSGIVAILTGPLKGIPYKIYAVEWGARGGSLAGFLLISIPARYIRFFLAAVVARLLARSLEPFTGCRSSLEILILAIIWSVFYAFYFWRFGW